MIINYTEYLVREVLKENRGLSKTNKPEILEEDIIRMVLNRMAPKYFFSNSSEGEKKAYIINRQLRLEALIKLTEAIEQLSEEK